MELVQLADLWEENQECLKQHLGRSDSRRFGARWVLMPTVPAPRFCHVSRIRVEEREVEGLLTAARDFFWEQGIPTCSLLVTPATRPASLGLLLHRLGFRMESNPVMLREVDLPVPAPSAAGVRVERVSIEKLDLYWELLRQTFFAGAPPEAVAEGRRGAAVSFAIGAINYVAYLDGQPAGAGTLFPRGSMGGVYNMCTLPHHRRRGVASAILAACVADARQAGCGLLGLTPTQMGRPLYEWFGFREVYHELYFSKPV